MHFRAFLYLDSLKHLRAWKNTRNIQSMNWPKGLRYVTKGGMELNEEMYLYGIKTAFVLFLNTLSLMAIGILMNMPAEGLIYILSFMLLRSYTGGYHISSNVGCYIVSCISMVVALILSKECVFESLIIDIVLCITAGILIYLYAPMEHKNRPLNKTERRIFRRKSIYIFIIEFIFGIISGIMGWNCQIILAAIFVNFCAMLAELWHIRVR